VIVFPAVATLVSAVFAIQLLTSYAHRKRLPHLGWGIAMAMYAVASLAVAAGVSGGWDPTLYRIYWLFGALLNVPYLALGSVALLGRKPVSAIMIVIVFVSTVIAVTVVATSSVHIGASVSHDIPRGSAAWGKGTLAAKLPTYMSIPAYVIVVLIAIGSSRGGKLPVHRVRGNWLIAIGATVVAAGAPFARYGRGAAFSVLLAIGVIVMFLGFRLAARAPKPAPAPEGD
jgi:hypothetical protein